MLQQRHSDNTVNLVLTVDQTHCCHYKLDSVCSACTLQSCNSVSENGIIISYTLMLLQCSNDLLST